MVSADKPEKFGELPQFTDEDFQHIEAAGGIESPNKQFRHKFVRCIRCAYLEPDYSDVRPKKFLDTVRNLRAHAEHLLRDLNHPNYAGDDESRQAEALAYAAALDWLDVSRVLNQDLRVLIEQADQILGAAPPEKSGRPVKVRFRALIACLTDLYYEFTGHPADECSIYLFVDTCLKGPASDFYWSKGAVRMALQRHLTERRGLEVDKT